MELSRKAIELEYVALGGKIDGRSYTAPTFDNARIRHLDTKITSALLDYRHAMANNVIRAQIPSYRRRMLEIRDGKVKELRDTIQSELDKIPEYVRSQALHKMLEAIREAERSGVEVGDTFDKKKLEGIFTALGGKIHSKTGKKRTRLTLYVLPDVQSDAITRLNDEISSESGKYMHVESTMLGKLPTVKKKREAKYLANIERAERQLEKEKMKDPRYAAAHAALDVIYAYNDVEKTATKEMAD